MLNPEVEDLSFLLVRARWDVEFQIWVLVGAEDEVGVVIVDVDLERVTAGWSTREVLAEVVEVLISGRVVRVGIISASRTADEARSLELMGAAKVPVETRTMAAMRSRIWKLKPQKSLISIVLFLELFFFD